MYCACKDQMDRGEDCMKHICQKLKEFATEIINYEIKKCFHEQKKKRNCIISNNYVQSDTLLLTDVFKKFLKKMH